MEEDAMKNSQRFLALFLCLILCFSIVPVTVFAEDLDDAFLLEILGDVEPEAVPEEDAAPVFFEEAVPVTEEPADEAFIPEVPEEADEAEATEPEVTAEPAEPEFVLESDAEPSLLPETFEEPSADAEEELFVIQDIEEAAAGAEEAAERVAPALPECWNQHFVSSLDFSVSSDDLLEGYMAEALYGEAVPSGMGPGLAKKNFGARLKGNDARVYKAAKAGIAKVANGKRTSTNFSFSAKKLFGKSVFTETQLNNGAISVDWNAVFAALYYDSPYEVYWMERIAGIWSYTSGDDVWTGEAWDFSNVKFHVVFCVTDEYSNGKKTTVTYGSDTYKLPTGVKTSTATRVKKAVTNAKAIVSNASGLGDVAKLKRYATKICSLVYYDEYDNTYSGDAHQLINIFDGDPDTNVLCEGYSKGFQYLCDLTKFDRKIACYILTGTVDFGDGNGSCGHMWNAVTMDNGKNYLVDVTNSDGYGLDGRFNNECYLRKATKGSASTGYTIKTKSGQKWRYEYDQFCKDATTAAARTITKKTYLTSPLIKSLTNADSGIKITWTKISEATSYRVMRKVGTGSWKEIKETTSTSFTDKNVKVSKKYKYAVVAVKGSVTSGKAPVKSITRKR